VVSTCWLHHTIISLSYLTYLCDSHHIRGIGHSSTLSVLKPFCGLLVGSAGRREGEMMKCTADGTA
jgi:hypothetical protein